MFSLPMQTALDLWRKVVYRYCIDYLLTNNTLLLLYLVHSLWNLLLQHVVLTTSFGGGGMAGSIQPPKIQEENRME